MCTILDTGEEGRFSLFNIRYKKSSGYAQGNLSKKKIIICVNLFSFPSNRTLEVDSPQMAGYQTATQFGEYSNSSFLFFSFCSDGPVRHVRTAQQPVQPNCLATSSTRSTQRHPEEEENCSEKNEVLIDGRKCPFDFYAK